MKTVVAILFAFCSFVNAARAQNSSPAMVGQGPGSVAAALHYPKGAKAAKNEAAVQFYCEVGPDGRSHHVRVIAEDPRGAFYWAVREAVSKGRFIPATVNGHAVPVLMGGTVLFLNGSKGPAMVVSLSTAEKQKAASGQNYIQPQLLMSYPDLTRNMLKFVNSTSYTGGGTPNAEIGFNVDASGAITNSRVISEVPVNAGQILVQATRGARFIPARLNGKPVAGQFNLPVDYRMMKFEDEITGSHLGPRQE